MVSMGLCGGGKRYWDCVAAVNVALSFAFGTMDFTVELWNHQRLSDEALLAETS